MYYILHKSPFSKATRHIKVVGQELAKEPLHFDIGDYTKYEASDFFPAFVDLYLIGNSKCVSYGKGGYGKFGLVMNFNYTCGFNHRTYNNVIQRCPKPPFLN